MQYNGFQGAQSSLGWSQCSAIKQFILGQVSGILSERPKRTNLSTALQHVCRVLIEQASPAGMQPAQA